MNPMNTNLIKTFRKTHKITTIKIYIWKADCIQNRVNVNQTWVKLNEPNGNGV